MTGKPKTGLRRPSSVDSLRASASTPAPLEAAPPPPAEGPQQPRDWPVRIPLTIDAGMRRALRQAQVDDDIETTARIRAMIHLWQDDDQFRARVNELAPGFRASRGRSDQ